ncbi:M15 family metallopeptidase [Chitinophaga sp.]|uniref:M15 family metallopeptidase n=1 Tax=Chitinophaga sp. TaxID=1869181 RepID=UPI002FDD6135
MKNLFILCFLGLSLAAFSQTAPPNKYGLAVVGDMALYHQLVKSDPAQELVRVTEIPIDVKYATDSNFTKTQLYPYPAVYLRRPVYQALLQLQEFLSPMGLSLKIYDGYRPYRVTEKMWEVVPDERYAADPRKGSGHNRGAAVDLTIVYTKTGKEMEMPTPYDDFTQKAHHNAANVTPEAAENRTLLRTLMEAHGFVALETEWWHYALKGAARFPLMDISFEDLR